MQNRYDDEVEYWKGALSNAFSSGADSNSKYRKLLDVELELDPTIAKELPQPAPEGGWRVLDVGCGPLTVLGKKFQNSRLNITGVDPLADQYMQMLTELGVVPPFEARQGFGEEVNRYFPHNHFDLVYSRNALDHSQHPHLARAGRW